MSSRESDLAKALVASQEAFAHLADTQTHQMDMLMSPSRHYRPIQFRQEREFSREIAEQRIQQIGGPLAKDPTEGQNERRLRELAMYNYIVHQTTFLSEDPEQRERESRLLRHYIELYAHNPKTYPVDPHNPTHCVVHEAGRAVLRAEQQNRHIAELNHQSTKGQNRSPSIPLPWKKVSKT
jgi:hypothetical protein